MKNTKVNIIMYHYVRELKHSKYPQIRGLDFSLFKEQIDFLNSHYNIITMEELIAYYEEGYNLPDNAAILTFDDGYIDHFTNVFPILNAYHIQGSFFIPGKTFREGKVLDVNKIHFILAAGKEKNILNRLNILLNKYRGTEFEIPSNEELFQKYGVETRFDSKEINYIKKILQTVLPEALRTKIVDELFIEIVGVSEDSFSRELYMNQEQIACMRRNGMFIGLHGYDHYWLGNLSYEKFAADTEKALNCMQDFIRTDKWVMNYPYGSYNEKVIKYIKENGCSLAMGTEVRIASLSEECRYALPRLDTNDFPPKSENYKTM